MLFSPEFDFVENTHKQLGTFANENGLDDLTPAERVVLLTWWAKGIIDNGGFEYFYEGATNTLEVAEAFEALGYAEAAAAACRAAHAQVPPDVLAGGWEACREWMAPFEREEFEARFEAANQAIWRIGDELQGRLADYIRAHLEAFIHASSPT